MPLFSVLSLASGVADLPCLLLFQTSKSYAGMFGCMLVLAYTFLGVKVKVKCTGALPNSSVTVIPTCPSQHPFWLAGSHTP